MEKVVDLERSLAAESDEKFAPGFTLPEAILC